MLQKLLLSAFVILIMSLPSLAQSKLIITEIMFDVTPDPNGDVNGDGVRSPRGDEFVEILNKDNTTIDISAYQILERNGIAVFTFPIGTTLDPGKIAVVFGGVGPNGFGSNLPKNAQYFAAQPGEANKGFGISGKSNLSNSRDCVVLVNSVANDTIAEVYWGSASPVSSKAIYLDAPNTVNGDSIAGAIGQSVTIQPGTGLWGLYTVVAENSDSFYSPGYVDPAIISDVKEKPSSSLPAAFELLQNYPNPFNPLTDIGFHVAMRGFVTLKIYNLLGKEIATLVSKELNSGSYSVKWSGEGFASGIYLYRLTVNGYTQTRKMVLAK